MGKRSAKLFSSNAQLGGRYGRFLCKYPTAKPEKPWKIFADILMAAKIYE
jgi:hypothetical protein